MARKIFYISNYWRVLKIRARTIRIEAYGLVVVVGGGGGHHSKDCGSHLLNFTTPTTEKMRFIVSNDSCTNYLVICWKSRDIRAIQYSIQLWSAYEIGGNKKPKNTREKKEWSATSKSVCCMCIYIYFIWMNE